MEFERMELIARISILLLLTKKREYLIYNKSISLRKGIYSILFIKGTVLTKLTGDRLLAGDFGLSVGRELQLPF
uniref:Uncharacterized protein n=1 Tax=Picea glauca TaxID=3330 RepID=A0A101LXV8_PICGL|nr:hypothetical protein ABT39_MTgene5521 [Picea glauca]